MSDIDGEARKRLIRELEAERRGLQADMSNIQRLGLLSERNERIARINEEIKQLSSRPR